MGRQGALPRGAPQLARAARVIPQPRAHTPSRMRTASLLAVCCFLVYLTSLRCSPSWDTIPARLLPFSILREGNLDLNEFSWLHGSEAMPYFLQRRGDGKLLSKYPVAAPLLATPVALPALWWLRSHGVSDEDVRFRLATVVVERVTAAVVVAVSVSLLFLALCTVTTSTTLAVAMTLVYGLGSNTWATSSQALWQHGVAELSLAGLSLFFLKEDTRTNAAVASIFAALGVLARPTMAIFALLATLFVWRERRGRLAAFMALPVAGGLCVVLYNVRSVGSVLGGYSGVTFVAPDLKRLLGLLVSPNRGLFIFTPAAALALPGLLRWRSHRAAWIPYLAGGTLGYLLLYSSYVGWWGGHTYGPRFLIDVFPALVLCAVPTVERLAPRRLGRAVLIACAAWSVAVQAVGAYCDFDSWNHVPLSIDKQSQRAWDWKDPQIVRALQGGWHGTDLGPLLWQMLADPRPPLLQALDRSALAGAIVIENPPPLRFRAGRLERLSLQVSNRGTAMWPAFSDFGHLDCRVICLWKLGDANVDDSSQSLRLPRNLGPGETVRIVGLISTPSRPGTYDLELVLVQLLGSDKGIYGGAHAKVPVQVE
jgi:hypothetical protein